MQARIDGTVRIGGQASTDRIDMQMTDEVESSVTTGTFEATGEVVFGSLTNEVHAAFDS